jgi:hypothetical protein
MAQIKTEQDLDLTHALKDEFPDLLIRWKGSDVHIELPTNYVAIISYDNSYGNEWFVTFVDYDDNEFLWEDEQGEMQFICIDFDEVIDKINEHITLQLERQENVND